MVFLESKLIGIFLTPVQDLKVTNLGDLTYLEIHLINLGKKDDLTEIFSFIS